jgi:hypothetical protein
VAECERGHLQAMADPQIVSTLTRKRDEIEATINAYEKKIAAARRDLASANATLRLFKLDGEASEFRSIWTG